MMRRRSRYMCSRGVGYEELRWGMLSRPGLYGRAGLERCYYLDPILEILDPILEIPLKMSIWRHPRHNNGTSEEPDRRLVTGDFGPEEATLGKAKS
jgi:hypothetical protein